MKSSSVSVEQMSLEKKHGRRESIFLSAEELAAMEPLVHTKMEESSHRIIVEWDASEARHHLVSCLIDTFCCNDSKFGPLQLLRM